jgi:2-keto-3-deoxy-L-rhamnonate aldolase RhmA
MESSVLTFTIEDAQAAVRICKYPPTGTRSMTGQLPQFNLASTPVPTIISESNAQGSMVFVMIETKSSIKDIDSIASTPGVDVLLIGSNDLSIELGVPGDFGSEVFRDALRKVSDSAKRHNLTMGLAGVYDNPELQGWAVGELGVKWILGQQDSGVLAGGMKGVLAGLNSL